MRVLICGCVSQGEKVDFNAKMSTDMVYVTTTKRVQECEKLVLTFQNSDFSEFSEVPLGDSPQWGIPGDSTT